MKRQRTLGAVVLLMLCVACARPVTIVTPEGQAAYTADQVLQRVEGLQRAAIMAAETGGLPEATAQSVVRVTVSVAELADAAQAGWAAAVKAAWQKAKAEVPALKEGRLVIYVAAIDELLLGGGQ